MTRLHALVPALLLAVLPARGAAQSYPTDRGSFIVGGSASLTTSKASIALLGSDEELRSTTLAVAPSAQYFVAPGLAVGGRVQSYTTWVDGESSGTFGVGPQLSYFFGRGDRRLYPYLSAGVSYDQEVGDSDNHGSGVNAAGGLVFMLGRQVGLDTSLGFNHVSAGTTTLQTFGLALGITAFAF